jgi:SPP1 gp7 family putative phage head morphogenesis protein
MATNSQLTAQTERHAVYVQRFANRLDDEFIPFLDRLKKDIAGYVAVTEWQAVKQDALLRELSAIQTQIYNEYNSQLILDLNEFGVSESEWQQRSLQSIVPSDSDIVVSLPSPQKVITAGNTIPLVFPDLDVAKQMDAFIRDWSVEEVRRTNNIITRGWAMGLPNDEIIKEISGKDGYLDRKTRSNNEAIVRTSVNHMSTTSRHATMIENDDIIIGYTLSVTLDGRTSDICINLPTNKVFKFTDSYQPRPPFHPRCRTLTEPEVDGRYKTKGDTETKPKSYYEWLKKQAAQFQDETIGPTRGKLLRNGGMTAEEFRRLSTDDKFRPLSLEAMRRKDPEAFEDAGL